MDYPEHPAKKIRFLLTTHSMTVRNLADKLGVTLDYVQRILSERELPSASLLYQICALFDVHEDFFTEQLRTGSKGGQGGVPPHLPPEAVDKRRRASRRRAKRLNLSELLARQQALVDLLVARKIFTQGEYQMHLEVLRTKIAERQRSR